jgi:hypothetical protein
MKEIASLFDYAFATSKRRLKDYQEAGAKAYYLPPASDEETHFFDPQPKFKVDVSMVISDFYDRSIFPALVSREAIAKELCSAAGITFALYGPEKLRSAVPNCYRGPIDQRINRQVFSSSKINIATHALDGEGYMSDRVPFILLSKGLMLIDPVDISKSLLKDGESCFVIDTTVPIAEQVKKILAKPASELNRIRSNGKKIAVQNMSYASWARTIINAVGAQ